MSIIHKKPMSPTKNKDMPTGHVGNKSYRCRTVMVCHTIGL